MAIDGASAVPSPHTLAGIPGRVFTLLIGVAQSLPARSALGAKGFDEAEHGYAWSRLQALGELQGGAPKLDAAVRDAVIELDAWDEPNFEAIRHALLRNHPEQAAFLFENLEAAQGPEAVLGVERLLGRIEVLESGEGRDATREKDRAAVALLAKRGYTPEERARLRAMVELARSVAPVPKLTDEERQRLLVELYRWLLDWSSQARQCITARSTLIRLGLAKRRRRAAEVPEEAGDAGDESDGTDAAAESDESDADDVAVPAPLRSGIDAVAPDAAPASLQSSGTDD